MLAIRRSQEEAFHDGIFFPFHFPSTLVDNDIMLSVGFSGAPNYGTPYPYYSHTTPIRIPKDMGMVWE